MSGPFKGVRVLDLTAWYRVRTRRCFWSTRVRTFFLHGQSRDGWTHELDLRPSVETW